MFVENMLPRALARLALIDVEAPVRAAADLMAKPHTDIVVVCDHGEMVGVVTKTDIVGQISRCIGAGCIARVDSIMTRDVTHCRATDLLYDVWSLMNRHGFQRIPVLGEGRKPIGVIYTRDALQNLLDEVENDGQLLRGYIFGVGYQ